MHYRHSIGLVVLMTLAGCESPSSESSGEGGQMSTTTTSVSDGGSTGGDGGSGGSGGAIETVTFGPSEDCEGNTPYAPFDADLDMDTFPDLDLIDETGAPLHGDGSLACVRIVPPTTPYRFTSWEMGFSLQSICKVVPEAVSFVASQDPAWPIEVTKNLQIIKPDTTKSPAVIPLDVTIDAPPYVLYLCARLPVSAAGRGCALACKTKNANPNAANTLWSHYRNGVVDVLPDVDLVPLSVSPSHAIADYFQASAYQFRFTAYGHAL